jgi:hypothetical protein
LQPAQIFFIDYFPKNVAIRKYNIFIGVIMNKNIPYFIVLCQAIIFSLSASDSCVLNYNGVKDEHKVHIEDGIKAIFPDQSIAGTVNRLMGGNSGDGVYVVQIESFKCVFRCMKQPHSIALCQSQCQYNEMAAEKGLGPKFLYKNIENGIYATEFVESISLSPAHLEDKLTLEQFAHALRALHDSSIDSNLTFDIFFIIEEKIKKFVQHHPDNSIELEIDLDVIQSIKTVIEKHTTNQKHVTTILTR